MLKIWALIFSYIKQVLCITCEFNIKINIFLIYFLMSFPAGASTYMYQVK